MLKSAVTLYVNTIWKVCFYMVYYTGDIHGEVRKVCDFILKNNLTSDDVIVILGDVGINYFGNDKGDAKRKKILDKYNVPILCVHGNHEMRPESLGYYTEIDWHGGKVYWESDYPNIFFAKDGEIYDLDAKKHIAIGGAYSVDKFHRLAMGTHWFADEQPSEEIKKRGIEKLNVVNWKVDAVLSHTCPYKYRPTETFLPFINQDTVDNSTEHWFDEIEDKLQYSKWLCGHWHIDKKIDRIRFMMNDFECSDFIGEL